MLDGFCVKSIVSNEERFFVLRLVCFCLGGVFVVFRILLYFLDRFKVVSNWFSIIVFWNVLYYKCNKLIIWLCDKLEGFLLVFR